MPEMTVSEALRLALEEEMRRDERVLLLGEDIGVYGGAFGVTRGLLDAFGPSRVLDTPISENSFVGVAVGAAMDGLRPVVEIMFMDFLFLAFDQLLNGAAKFHYIYDGQVNVPLVVRTPGGAKGGYGSSHSQTLTAQLHGLPGLTVVAPSDARSARGMLKAAIRDDNPVVFVESKPLYPTRGPVPEKEEVLPLRKAAVVREGEEMTLVGLGGATRLLLEAAEVMAEGGFEAEVVDLRCAAPLDLDTVFASLEKTRRLLIAEEGHVFGGVGAELAAAVAERKLDVLEAPIGRVGAAHTPIPAAPELEKLVLPSVATVLAKAREMLEW